MAKKKAGRPGRPPGPPRTQLLLRVAPELVDAVDSIRGSVPRTDWCRMLLEAATAPKPEALVRELLDLSFKSGGRPPKA